MFSGIDEGDFMKEAFNADKFKLRKVLDKIDTLEKVFNDAKSIGDLRPQETIQIPLECKAPLRFREKKYDIVVNIVYRYKHRWKEYQLSCTSSIQILPTGFSIALGVVLGGVLGSVVKIITLANKEVESTKGIGVDCFSGSVLLGALVGLFSNTFIEILGFLIK